MREQLKIDLVSVGKSNAQNSSISVEEAMSAIADKIADAIERGAIRLRFSRVTVDELNSVEDCRNGDFYVVSDSGIVFNGMDGEPMSVEKNSVLFYNGSFFEILFSLEEIIGFDPEEILKKIDVEIQARTLGDRSNANALSTHVSDRSNPHDVTAEQVGAYTKEQVDSEIKKESDARELYDSQLRESIEALEEKTGDFVTGEEVSAAISAEADARIQEDIALNARIDLIPQTDWNETDEGSMAYLANHPTPISDIDIEALFS